MLGYQSFAEGVDCAYIGALQQGQLPSQMLVLRPPIGVGQLLGNPLAHLLGGSVRKGEDKDTPYIGTDIFIAHDIDRPA